MVKLKSESQLYRSDSIEEEVEGITLAEVVEAARLVLGQRTVERLSNNINISGDLLQELLQPEEL